MMGRSRGHGPWAALFSFPASVATVEPDPVTGRVSLSPELPWPSLVHAAPLRPCALPWPRNAVNGKCSRR